MDLCRRETVSALLSRHGFHFSKNMGQNFLVDPAIPEQIAQAAGIAPGWGVLEIGPGIGALTAALARRADKVVCVELDKRLPPILAETLRDYPNVQVVPGDILKLALPRLLEQHFAGRNVMVCANLPYNITTPVLTRLVETPEIQRLTVMVQREVAARLCASPGSSAAGAFSLYLQYYMEVQLLFDVPRTAFFPSPKVTSSVVQCRRRAKAAVETEDEAFFFRLIRSAFALRRKTLANALTAAFGEADKDAVAAAIACCGLPPAIRGEALSLQDFAALARQLALNGSFGAV